MTGGLKGNERELALCRDSKNPIRKVLKIVEEPGVILRTLSSCTPSHPGPSTGSRTEHPVVPGSYVGPEFQDRSWGKESNPVNPFIVLEG